MLEDYQEIEDLRGIVISTAHIKKDGTELIIIDTFGEAKKFNIKQ